MVAGGDGCSRKAIFSFFYRKEDRGFPVDANTQDILQIWLKISTQWQTFLTILVEVSIDRITKNPTVSEKLNSCTLCNGMPCIYYLTLYPIIQSKWYIFTVSYTFMWQPSCNSQLLRNNFKLLKTSKKSFGECYFSMPNKTLELCFTHSQKDVYIEKLSAKPFICKEENLLSRQELHRTSETAGLHL